MSDWAPPTGEPITTPMTSYSPELVRECLDTHAGLIQYLGRNDQQLAQGLVALHKRLEAAEAALTVLLASAGHTAASPPPLEPTDPNAGHRGTYL